LPVTAKGNRFDMIGLTRLAGASPQNGSVSHHFSSNGLPRGKDVPDHSPLQERGPPLGLNLSEGLGRSWYIELLNDALPPAFGDLNFDVAA